MDVMSKKILAISHNLFATATI